jgi:glycerophosphoryl diester phosphodiesterase
MCEFGEYNLEAIGQLARLGVCLEADVSVTTDGTPVLWHPRGLARVRTRHSLSLTRDQITSARVNGRRALYPLRTVLAAFPSLRLLIDVKQWPAVHPAARVIAESGAAGRVSIGTFSDARTRATAQAIADLSGEAVCAALGPLELARFAVGGFRVHDERGTVETRILQLPHRLVSATLVERAHRQGLIVFAWTVNEDETMARLIELGVDGIITDWPIRLTTRLATAGDQVSRTAGDIQEGVVNG